MLPSRRAHPAFEFDAGAAGVRAEEQWPPPQESPQQPQPPSPLLTARASAVPLQSLHSPTATPLHLSLHADGGGAVADSEYPPAESNQRDPDTGTAGNEQQLHTAAMHEREREPHPATAQQPLARSAIRAAMRLTPPQQSKLQSPIGILPPSQQQQPTQGSSQYRTARFPSVGPASPAATAASASTDAPASSFAVSAAASTSGAQTTRQQLLHRSHSVSTTGTPARGASPASTHRRPQSTASALGSPLSSHFASPYAVARNALDAAVPPSPSTTFASPAALASPHASALASPYAVARNALDAAVSPPVASPVAKQVMPPRASLHRAFAVDDPIQPASDVAGRGRGGGGGILSLLRGLSDKEFRRVVERWLEGELSAAPAVSAVPAPIGLPAAPTRAVPSAASSLHAGLVSSYLYLHSWEHAAPLLLRSAFRFLSLYDLVRGVRRTCRRWHQALQPLSHPEQERGWEASQSLQLPAAASSASSFTPLSNSALLPIFTSLPLLRSLSFVSLVTHRNDGFDAGFDWGICLARMQVLLPHLSELKIEGGQLTTKDLAALLPAAASGAGAAAASAVQAELSASMLEDSALSASQLLRPSVCHLSSLELLHCLPIDVRVMELLAALPSLRTLALHSTEALTASRSCGLQLLSNSGAQVQGPISPIASAARIPSHHQQLMQDATSASQCCFPSLTALSLAPLSSDAALTHLLPCTRLQSLELTGCLSDTGLESLCVLVSLVSLRIEVLYELARGRAGGSALSPSASASRHNGSLPPLMLSPDEMSSLCDGRGLVALESLQHLKSLEVCIPALSIRGMEALCALSQLEALKVATSSSSYYAPTLAAQGCVSPLASLPTFLSLLSFLPVLCSLDLSGLPFLSDEQISFLPHPSVCARLRRLNLRGLPSLSDTACYWLGKLRALQVLDLRGCGSMRGHRGIQELRAGERMKDCVILWTAVEEDEGAAGAGVAEEEAPEAPEPNPQPDSADVSSARSTTSEPIRSRAAASPPPLPPRSSSSASDRTDSPLSPQPPHLAGFVHPFRSASPSSPLSLTASAPWVPKSRAEQESDQIAALAAASSRAAAALQMRQELSKAESILQRLTANMAATVASNEARKNATPSPSPSHTTQNQQPQQLQQHPVHSPTAAARLSSFGESRDRPLSTSDFASPVRSAPPPETIAARQPTSVRPPTPKLATKPKLRSASGGGVDVVLDDDVASEWMLRPLSADPDPVAPEVMANGFAASSRRPFDPPAALSVDGRRSAGAPVPVSEATSSSSLESAFDAAESAAMRSPFQMHPLSSSSSSPPSAAAAHHRVSHSSPAQMLHAQSSNGVLVRPHLEEEDECAAPPHSHRSLASSESSISSSAPLAPHALFMRKSLFNGAVLASHTGHATLAAPAVTFAAVAATAAPSTAAVSLSSSLPAPSDDSVSLHRTPRMRRTKSAGTPNSLSGTPLTKACG